MEINISKKLEKININGEIIPNAPMCNYTSFKTGGTADILIVPRGYHDLIKIMEFSGEYNIPVFILGGGANILVADRGIRGIVIEMSKFNEVNFKNDICSSGAGLPISSLAETAANNNWGGLDFIYGMPGTVGGAVWMNARCYNVSVSDILVNVEYIDKNLNIINLGRNEIKTSFAYKISPFQKSDRIILSASFKLKKGIKTDIWEKMVDHKKDREQKGHYKFPSAGSVFKNNRNFGRPTGEIIDSLGLKGYSIGGAKIADFHGNIIINTGDAKSGEIKKIIDYTIKTVKENTGFSLEPEVQLIGDWDRGKNEYMD